jgi:hypothetical protein
MPQSWAPCLRLALGGQTRRAGPSVGGPSRGPAFMHHAFVSCSLIAGPPCVPRPRPRPRLLGVRPRLVGRGRSQLAGTRAAETRRRHHCAAEGSRGSA